MSQRLANETIRSAFSSPCCATTFPGTTVIARTSSSGEFRANINAMASSEPGSVSKIIFREAAKAGEASDSPTPAIANQIAKKNPDLSLTQLSFTPPNRSDTQPPESQESRHRLVSTSNSVKIKAAHEAFHASIESSMRCEVTFSH